MSKNNYAVMRFHKLKNEDQSKAIKKSSFKSYKTEINKTLKHNLRIDDLKHIDKNKKNYVVVGSENIEEVLNSIDLHVNKEVKQVKRDNVVAFEFVLTFSNPAEIDLKKWIDKNKKYLTNKFGKENLHSLILHNDETTPHLHAIVTPIVNGKLNAKHYTKTIIDLRAMQTEYAKEMEEFGLSRGQEKNILKSARKKTASEAKTYRIIKKAEKNLKSNKVKDEFIKNLNAFNFELSDSFINSIESNPGFTKKSAMQNKKDIIKKVKEEYERQLQQFKNRLLEENEKIVKALNEYKIGLDARQERIEYDKEQLQLISDDFNNKIDQLAEKKIKSFKKNEVALMQKQIDDFKEKELEALKEEFKEDIKRKDDLIVELKQSKLNLIAEVKELKEEVNLYKTLSKEEIKELRAITNKQIIDFICFEYKLKPENIINKDNEKLKSFDLIKSLYNCDMNQAIQTLQYIKQNPTPEIKPEIKKETVYSAPAPKPRF